MYGLIGNVVTCCVRSWDKGKIKATNKIMFVNHKKRKYGNKRIFTQICTKKIV